MIRALVVASMLVCGWAQAGVTAEEVAEIRAVIHRQIDAFKRDDARSAFALVSPDVQEAFGTPERFLAASREELEAVPGVPGKLARDIHEQLHRTGG